MSNHNLDQCLADLDAETRQMEEKVLGGIKKKSMNVMRQMMFSLAPVKTGFYRASFDMTINGISKYRRRTSKKMKERAASKMTAEAQEQIEKASGRLGEVKRIEDLHSISIANNAPHAHFIEGGGSKKAPAGVFSVGRQVANMELERLNSELR